jgi:TPR repeat protein
MTRCQVCGAAIKDDMKFCVPCTVKRAHSQAMKKNPIMNPGQGNNPEAVICFVCGERLGASAKKCAKCGTLKQDLSEVLKRHQKAAKNGDDCAQERLADMYLKGIGTDRDYKKALAWYIKSADQGNDTSQAQLGYMYEQALGVDQDYQKALALYRESAAAGNALGEARLGDMYYRGIGVEKDYERALAYFQAAAIKGNHLSQAKLADMYLLGSGVKADPRKALKWYLKSAEQGNGHSQAQLGGMCLHGVAVDRDVHKALAWYQKAVEQGNDAAQANLGLMYEKGLGVEKDLQKALGLYKKSAAQGHALGQARLGDMHLYGRGVEQDPQKAFKCFQKSAEQDNDLAQLRLGRMYCDGNGVEQDLEKGFAWVRKSAEQGNAKAQLLLGGMYKDGKGIAQDHQQAFAWIQKSAKQGQVIAQNDLGYLYQHGLGVDRDFQKAREWYLLAAKKGLDAALACLGDIYRDGLGVEENINEAKKWYVQAAEKGNEKAQAELLRIEQEADPEKKLKNRIMAAYQGDAKAMAEVATMYLTGTGVEKSEENALEWFIKAFDYGYESVRGELQQVQRSIAARREAENRAPESASPTTEALPGVQKGKSPAPRNLFSPFSVIGISGFALAIIFFSFIKKSGSSHEEGPAIVLEIPEPPRHKTELPVPAILETSPEISGETKKEKSRLDQNEQKSLITAEADHAAATIEPVAAVLRRECTSLDEQEISAMLGGKNMFDAQRNPSGNFRHQYEMRQVAELRLIADRATRLVWMRQQNLVRMSLEKIKDWIASLNRVRYGGIGDWRLPTVEEAASLLQKNPGDEKIFLDAIFGADITSIWTGDSSGESMSWIVDFQNGVIDQAKNKSRLPALMVSSSPEPAGP